MQTVARSLSPAQVTSQLVPLVSRLALNELPAAKMSACCLAAPVYALLLSVAEEDGGEARADVRDMYKMLCADSTPVIQRSEKDGFGASCLPCAREAVDTFDLVWMLVVPLFS